MSDWVVAEGVWSSFATAASKVKSVVSDSVGSVRIQ